MAPRSFHRLCWGAGLVVAVTLAAAGPLLTFGCQPAGSNVAPQQTTAVNPASPRRAAATSGTVQRTRLYQEAVLRFRRKDYPGALARLDRLSAQASGTDAAFLLRQRSLCLEAIHSGRSVVRTPSAETVPLAGLAPRATRPQKSTAADCGPRALLLACRELSVPAAATLPQLTRAAGTDKAGTTLAGLARAAKTCGLVATGVQMDQGALANLSRPAVAWVDGDHYLAVLRVNGDTAIVHDPNKPQKEEVPLSDLLQRSGGVLLTLTPPRR